MKRAAIILSAAALVSLMLQGCTVGPDFKQPAVPKVGGYTATPLTDTSGTPVVAGGEVQHFVEGQDIPGEWWNLFHSRSLNELIERSLRNNPDLKAAQAALAVARETAYAQQGAYYPTITADFSAARQKTSAALAPTPNSNALYFNLYTPQVSVSYVPDVFGLNRRTVESLDAQTEQARFALVATQITLTANVAAAAIEEASLRAQIDTTRALIAINTRMLGILRTRFEKGFASRLDVAAEESQLAQISATLPPLIKQLVQVRDFLTDLSGGYPDKALPEEFTFSTLELPGQLPVSLPARLVEQRPDVRQAEANLHAASAQIGVAVANRLPNIVLTANAGTAALSSGQIFAGSNSFWTLGANLIQPVFDGGTLLHKERAARAAYIQASEQYRSTVLAAFQNVADTLAALEQNADTLKSAAAAAKAAEVTLTVTKRQMEAGYTNNLAFSNAEIAYHQASINLVLAQANRYADTVALFQALGGGWWNRKDLTATEDTHD